MRTLWNVISFLAIVNLLALLLVIGWLWNSKRLTMDRMREIRASLAQTLPEAEASAKKAADLAGQEQAKASEAARTANPPIDSRTQAQYVSLVRREEAQSRQRLQDDRKMLEQQLAQMGGQLDVRKASLNQQQAKLEAAGKPDLQRKIDEQFMQAVKQYELAPPKNAKKMLVELINGGGRNQAVAYLKAMNPRAASKILREFKSDPEIVMAKELLESLRTQGLDLPETPAAAKPAQDPSANAPADRNAVPQAPAKPA